jgi:chromosome segregation ATPase
MTKRPWAWHIHHKRLLEPLTEPIDNRRDCIERYKPAEERPLRLRLIKPVTNLEMLTNNAAWQQWEEAERQWEEAERQLQAAERQWQAAERQLQSNPDILALHAIECPDCPWDGQTIFSDKQGVRR